MKEPSVLGSCVCGVCVEPTPPGNVLSVYREPNLAGVARHVVARELLLGGAEVVLHPEHVDVVVHGLSGKVLAAGVHGHRRH